VAQRDVLENSINLLNTLRGPAKIFYATSNAAMPSMIAQAVNPTTGAPATPWVAFGLTRGGINVNKTLDVTIRDDVDQIIGAYDQDITDRYYTVTTQLAEVLSRPQVTAALDLGVETIVVATSGLPTQVMQPLDDGDNVFTERRWMVVYPKATAGKLYAFVFRRGQVSGGERVFRFDKTDPVSPALELRMFPEIATTIPAADAYGRLYQMD
jgi:hypothetical protein